MGDFFMAQGVAFQTAKCSVSAFRAGQAHIPKLKAKWKSQE
jgi:hypothetical protein